MEDIIVIENREDDTLTINKVHFNQEQSQIVAILINQYMTIKNAYNQLTDFKDYKCHPVYPTTDELIEEAERKKEKVIWTLTNFANYFLKLSSLK